MTTAYMQKHAVIPKRKSRIARQYDQDFRMKESPNREDGQTPGRFLRSIKFTALRSVNFTPVGMTAYTLHQE